MTKKPTKPHTNGEPPNKPTEQGQPRRGRGEGSDINLNGLKGIGGEDSAALWGAYITAQGKTLVTHDSDFIERQAYLNKRDETRNTHTVQPIYAYYKPAAFYKDAEKYPQALIYDLESFAISEETRQVFLPAELLNLSFKISDSLELLNYEPYESKNFCAGLPYISTAAFVVLVAIGKTLNYYTSYQALPKYKKDAFNKAVHDILYNANRRRDERFEGGRRYWKENRLIPNEEYKEEEVNHTGRLIMPDMTGQEREYHSGQSEREKMRRANEEYKLRNLDTMTTADFSAGEIALFVYLERKFNDTYNRQANETWPMYVDRIIKMLGVPDNKYSQGTIKSAISDLNRDGIANKKDTFDCIERLLSAKAIEYAHSRINGINQ